ncbi:aminodeoxychorismate/anthranilate synthase component II [Candidatus Micrarchaeota archaeon]|nr:aminodeoxychorismate/anthranilate synthase component II [Candidatus Micrarchaeota archaeon]
MEGRGTVCNKRILIIDNYDSFVYNLYQCLGELGAEPIVRRNDEVTLEGIREMNVCAIVLSPGPGHPENARDFGVCADVLSSLPDVPILGVCLGHQGIITHFGGKVGKVLPMHGKVSVVSHSGKGLFEGIPNPLEVMRYHSLAGLEIPECLEVCANVEGDGCVMAVAHRAQKIYGLQFHPESIMTQEGKGILYNFLKIAGVL